MIERPHDSTISCKSCEAICCRLMVVLMPDDHIPAGLIDHDDRGLEIMARNEDGWCAALDRDTFRCSIYETRPYICGYFEMGGSQCQDERDAWRTIPSVTLTQSHP